MNWEAFVARLKSIPRSVHRLEPPLPSVRIIQEETRLGKLPSAIAEMVSVFNGGELFVDADALVTLFGFSSQDNMDDSDWYVDRFTPIWREKMNRPSDWVVGMSTNGGIYILDEAGRVREWDSSSKRWTGEPLSTEQWSESILSDGQTILGELD